MHFPLQAHVPACPQSHWGSPHCVAGLAFSYLMTLGSGAIPGDNCPVELPGHAAPGEPGLGGPQAPEWPRCHLAALWALQSLVLVSRLPFVRLFQALLGLIAPEYFDKLAPCLEAGERPSGQARSSRRPATVPSGFGQQPLPGTGC